MQKDSWIEDNSLAEFLRYNIRQRSPEVQEKLKSVMHCGARLMPLKGEKQGVTVLSDGKKATFSGLCFCDNVYICPHCQASIMTKYADRIAIALDEMSKIGYKAIMATFTFPHLRFVSCEDGVKILAHLKKNFMKKQKGTTAQNFLDELGIKDYVWSTEFTYSKKHGWHPHYHTLFWVEADKIGEVLKWEDKLTKLWLNSAKRIMLNMYPDTKKTVETLFEKADNKRGGVFFSKDKFGKVREITSEKYMLGWKTSQELTGLEIKTAAKGHYTPRQLLEKAYKGDRRSLDLYFEYALATKTKTRMRRVQFSHGFVKRIKVWQQQSKSREYIVKKKDLNFRPIVWFSFESWKYICYELPLYTQTNILYLARYPDLLLDYLQAMNIAYELPADVPYTQFIADAYNNAA